MKTNQTDKATTDLILENLLNHRRAIASWEIKHIQAEHAALVAVVEAAEDALAFRGENESRIELNARSKFQSAIANLEAVRKGAVKA